MKCPKCGNEYEGVSCPQCKEVKIVINDSDYLRRKKEWEENGKILGVKVKKNSLDIQTPNIDEEIDLKFPKIPKVKIDIEKMKDFVNKEIKKKMNKKDSNHSNEKDYNKSNEISSIKNDNKSIF